MPFSFFRRTGRARRAGTHAGGALTMVLVAIALLTALLFMMTRSERGGGAAGEQDALAAAQIMEYGANLRQAVELVLSNGADIREVGFENGTTATSYANGDSTAATRVFDTAGGGMSYLAPEPRWLDPALVGNPYYGEWLFPDNVCVPFVGQGADGSGTTTICRADGVDNEELTAVLLYVRQDICIRINRELDIPLCSGVPCEQAAGSAGGSAPYTGAFADGISVDASGGIFNRRRQGCLLLNGTATYAYYQVLAAR